MDVKNPYFRSRALLKLVKFFSGIALKIGVGCLKCFGFCVDCGFLLLCVVGKKG